ncbi:hypothetical protein P4E94_10545 [Pontiellaceae bacterium B12219]|nr:hypothetical protein [Pontiellaceae bacterium B12219]
MRPEIESHTGLFIQSGYDSFEFAHRSLQEYLAAEYIVRLPSIPVDEKFIKRLPNELAIAVTISSNQSDYFTDLVMTRLMSIEFFPDFYTTFITRLLQEKPEFHKHPSVTLALLTLYSCYINGAYRKAEAQQMSLFYVDELTNEYEEFMQRTSSRNSHGIIFQQYEVSGRQTALDGSQIMLLKLKETIATGACKPKHLFGRKSFFEDTGLMSFGSVL